MERPILAITASETSQTRQLARRLRRHFYVHFCDISSSMLSKTLKALRPDAALIDLAEAGGETACKLCGLLHELKAVVIDVSALSDADSEPFDGSAFFLAEPAPEDELPAQVAAIVENGIALAELLRFRPDANIGELLGLLHQASPDTDTDEIIGRFAAFGVPEQWVIDCLYAPPLPAKEFEVEQEAEDPFFVQNAQEGFLFDKNTEFFAENPLLPLENS